MISFITDAFDCKKDELVMELTDFIEKIPTDLKIDINKFNKSN